MSLDPWTLWLMVMVVGLLLAASMLFVWLLTPEEKALGYWSAFPALLVTGIAGAVARGQIPDFLSVELANVAVLLGYGMIWAGMRRFDHRRVRWRHLLAAPALWLVLCLFPFIRDSTATRVVVSTLMVAALVGLALAQTWRGWVQPSRPRFAVFVLLCVVLALHLVRIPLLSTQVSGNQLTMYTDPRTAVAAISGIGITLFMNCALVLLVRERAEQVHRRAAHSDELTGLRNRRGFSEPARACCGEPGPVALMLLDLDHFKQINDRFGHATGDQVLKVFADVLRAHLRQVDLVARVGGEEFAALLPGADAMAAERAAARIRTAFAAAVGRLLGGDGEIACSASIGVACARFAAAGEAAEAVNRLDTLMRRADAVLYEAKQAGRDRVVMTTVT